MKHVLIVDDSAVVRKIVRRIVEGMELSIAEAEGCCDGLAICTQAMPDAIILDGSLTDMRPLDFVRQVRLLQNGHHPRIIYCSTENDVVHIAGAMRSGANMFMMKPFTQAELSGRLQDLAA
ncbi:MAG: response regulator [Beijerinckiaceae bacterium]|nr:response regulator [Beijerinckiaceae bacterium]